jgi:uncharacterized sodium:solute symporter family permease YidK
MPGPPQSDWAAGAAGGQHSILTKAVQTRALSILGLIIAAILLLATIGTIVDFAEHRTDKRLTAVFFCLTFFYAVVWSVTAINILKTIANNQISHNK